MLGHRCPQQQYIFICFDRPSKGRTSASRTSATHRTTTRGRSCRLQPQLRQKVEKASRTKWWSQAEYPHGSHLRLCCRRQTSSARSSKKTWTCSGGSLALTKSSCGAAVRALARERWKDRGSKAPRKAESKAPPRAQAKAKTPPSTRANLVGRQTVGPIDVPRRASDPQWWRKSLFLPQLRLSGSIRTGLNALRSAAVAGSLSMSVAFLISARIVCA